MAPIRITIVPYIHGKISRDGKMSEPDIHWIIDKWLERHPRIKKRSRDIRVLRGVMTLPQGVKTDLISATIIAADDIEGYDPTQDEDLYAYYLSEQQSEDVLCPADLNAGMIEAVTNPPHGFISKFSFDESDLAANARTIPWFARCGQSLDLELTMPTERVADWPTAIASCKDLAWENVELEAQNQLTLWLHRHDPSQYQKWNDTVLAHKASVVNPLIEQNVIPFQVHHGLDIALVHSVSWDILGALMENSFLSSGHKAFFFLELFGVYEAGHFPCGWVGEWPHGSLRVF